MTPEKISFITIHPVSRRSYDEIISASPGALIEESFDHLLCCCEHVNKILLSIAVLIVSAE